MTKNNRTVLIVLILAGDIFVLAYLLRDVILSTGRTVQCDDGPRQTIDIRTFTNDYWAYSAELEASLKDKGSIAAKLAPEQLQEISDGLQRANEFRKFVVAGYNACAISKSQYALFGAQFQALDSLSQEINSLLKNEALSAEEKLSLAKMIRDFSRIALEIGQTSRK